jgi:hypothetical protein
MHGETVEGVEAVSIIAPAVDRLIERRVLPPDALPLLRHIYAVAVKGSPVGAYAASFFRQPDLQLQPVDIGVPHK